MHITDTKKYQVQFWVFPFLTHITTIIKKVWNFEKLPNGLGDFRCLLYAQHVNVKDFRITDIFYAKLVT